MANDITGFGLIANIIASNTYATGIVIQQFADDADPLEQSAVQIGDTAMGLNGDLIVWSKAIPIPVVINVIPGSDDDEALQVLANANRVSQGRNSARDIITMTITYPDSSFKTLTGGKIVTAPFARSVASSGRQKTQSYAFSFQDVVGA